MLPAGFTSSRTNQMPLWASLLLAAPFSRLVSALPVANSTVASTNDWTQVAICSDKITWTPCFDGFSCSRLEVPLDWNDTSVGTTTVAFLKYSSGNESAEDLLLNFGGPGGSGVGTLLGLAPTLSQVFGSGVNLVGFDPRGVNNSGPVVNCFPDAATARIFDPLYYSPVTDGSLDDATTQFYLSEAFGKWCTPIIGGTNGTAKYVNTPSVARDMLAFIEAQNAANGKAEEDAKLWYAGYSYGTLLGTTFAMIYPDRVGRMVLDGVLDGEGYYKGLWNTNLLDTDEVVDYFIQTCFDGGAELCPFWAASVDLITDRLNNLLASMKVKPIPVWNNAVVTQPTLATYGDLTRIILSAVYLPIDSFPVLAQILADLEAGSGDTLIAASADDVTVQITSIIQCVDASNRNNITTLEEYRDFVAELVQQSKYAGEVWPSQVLSCRALDVTPPASGQPPKLRPSADETSFPLMLIANTADPVTPIRSARGVNADFPGSVLVTLEGAGHTSLAAPSTCIYSHIQAYLAGTVPSANSTCTPDVLPFTNGTSGLSK